ncbi:MAG: polyprenyl synthetase family protein [Bacteroidales bacterium]|jgi:geranylgeranyl diphosphate synthase type II|nr:polyprenyl synthetase family protein [Bacteroidales bacterium]
MYTLQEIGELIEKNVAMLDLGLVPEEMHESVKYMLSMGGKRIRPTLCLASYSMFSDNIDEQIIMPALALEIFHTFTLIHDDIMDKADLRRGKPTLYRKWNTNIAILSGDVMSIKACGMLSQAPADKLAQVLNLFTDTATKVCEGQQFDMNYESAYAINMEEYMKMIGLKTAVLIACAAKMGAIIAGAGEKACDALYDFAYDMGVAFQIQDDYFDSFGNGNIFGKKIGGDILNNKKTWFLVESMIRAGGKDKEKLHYLLSLNEEKSEEKITGMQDLYIKLGVKDAANARILDYYKKALLHLNDSGLESSRTALLSDYAKKLFRRNS